MNMKKSEKKKLKIAIIGAGGVIFAQKLIKDIMLNGHLRSAEVMLMDISRERLEKSMKFSRMLAKALKAEIDLKSTVDLNEAVNGADFVLTIFRSGGIECQRYEYEIPLKYGVKQVVGDTAGPGGIFRGLRVLKDLLPVVDAMEKYCPGAYLLNYVNPMSINTIAASRRAKTVKVIGICHSVQGTIHCIAEWLGVPVEEISQQTAGVNHQAFVLKLEHKGRDLYPDLHKLLDNEEIYRRDRVRFEIMRHFGYFPTESSGHGSEYLPYFRKRDELLEKFCTADFQLFDDNGIDFAPMNAGVSGASFRICRQLQQCNDTKLEKMLNGDFEIDRKPSCEYAIQLINAIVSNQPYQANLNVMNHGLIPSLPPECAVEVPCLVSGGGIQPCRIENYPEQLAGLNRGMINMQLMAAAGALNCDRRQIFQAVALDPLTAAVCSLDEIQQMTDELFEALREEINPEFFKEEKRHEKKKSHLQRLEICTS